MPPIFGFQVRLIFDFTEMPDKRFRVKNKPDPAKNADDQVHQTDQQKFVWQNGRHIN
jgi:hypothetical protein